MKKWISLLLWMILTVCCLTGCGNGGQQTVSDGAYTVEVTLEGGSGRASVQSPTEFTVENGTYTAKIIWSSDKYDYMVVDGEKYLPVTLEGGSTFEIPVEGLDMPVEVAADTTAMSQPHEISYTLTFHSDTLEQQK